MTTHPLVTVIIPTHEHDESLEYSVRSVLEQTVTELEVVIIGDGVTSDVRTIAERLDRVESRVRFEDHPKTPRHGESLRDRVIRDVSSPFIAYNGDDDLWLPRHLETMIEVIGERDFAHPLPILIVGGAEPLHIASNLRDPTSVAWHLGTTPRNSISLTGVVHTREAYLRLPHGWRETPVGRWTDHYMWQQFFEQEWFSGATSPQSTTLKLIAQADDRAARGGGRADIELWWEQMHTPGFVDEWGKMVFAAVRRAAVDHTVLAAAREDQLRDHLAELEATCDALLEARTALDSVTSALGTANAMLEGANAATDALSADLDTARAKREAGRRVEEQLSIRVTQTEEHLRALQATVSWRVTRPLRMLRLLTRSGASRRARGVAPSPDR